MFIYGRPVAGPGSSWKTKSPQVGHGAQSCVAGAAPGAKLYVEVFFRAVLLESTLWCVAACSLHRS